jgi:hypothetical protein
VAAASVRVLRLQRRRAGPSPARLRRAALRSLRPPAGAPPRGADVGARVRSHVRASVHACMRACVRSRAFDVHAIVVARPTAHDLTRHVFCSSAGRTPILEAPRSQSGSAVRRGPVLLLCIISRAGDADTEQALHVGMCAPDAGRGC